jgi:hypothetical protein
MNRLGLERQTVTVSQKQMRYYRGWNTSLEAARVVDGGDNIATRPTSFLVV